MISWLFRTAALAVIFLAFDESPGLFPAAAVAIAFLALDAWRTVCRALAQV